MRKVIAALQTSVDGYIGGPNKELDWAMTEDEEANTNNIGLPSWRTRLGRRMRTPMHVALIK